MFFEGKIGNKSDYKTFIRRKGLKYYEIHHFIQKNQKNTNKPLHNLKEGNSDAVIYGEKMNKHYVLIVIKRFT